MTDIAETGNVYAKDYRDAIQPLVACIGLITSSLEFQQLVFEGSNSPILPHGTFNYIEQFKLRMPMQCEWMALLGQRVESKLATDGVDWTIDLGESNGNAFINFARLTTVNNVSLRFGLQLQYWQLKAFAQPWPYLPKAGPEKHSAVSLKVNQIALELGLIGKPSRPKDMGFSSVNVFEKRIGNARYILDRWATEIAGVIISLDRLSPEIAHV